MANPYFSPYSKISDVKRCVNDAWRQILNAPDSPTKGAVIYILGTILGTLDAPNLKFTIYVKNDPNGNNLFADFEIPTTRKEYYDGLIVDRFSFSGSVYPYWNNDDDCFGFAAHIYEYNARLDKSHYPPQRTVLREERYDCTIEFNRNKVTKFRSEEGWEYLL